MSTLFQYAIIWEPNHEQIKTGAKAKVIVDMQTILAADKDSANMLAARSIPEAYVDQLDQVKIALRPF